METDLGLRTIAWHCTFMNALKPHSFRQPLHLKIINARQHRTVCGFTTDENCHRHVISFVSFCYISGKPCLLPPPSQLRSVHEVSYKMPVNFYELQKRVFVRELRLSQRCC